MKKTKVTKTKKIYKQRMYSLVLYNLAPIQKGIQSGHANDIYQYNYGKSPEFKQWIKNDRTVIILDGGSSSSLTKHIEELKKNGIRYQTFVEPDIYDNVSAVSFLVDERVWDKEKYVESFDEKNKWFKLMGDKNIFLRDFLKNFKLAI